MVATVRGDEAVISKLRCKLEFGGLTLPQKYRILFSLRNCSNASALDALLIALRDESALLRHDIAFAIGQRQDAVAVKELSRILEDSGEHCMVRHEAGEALGAIGTPECMEPLARQAESDVREVSETCVLAKQRMEYFEGLHGSQEAGTYHSVDPTPPYPSATPLEKLERIFLDEDAKLFDRYRALFALRNRGGDAAIVAMASCMQSSGSALLKHEVAFVLGQMLDKRAIECLKSALKDDSEHAMVRHEAAEALGAIGDDTCVELLAEYSKCAEPIIADSCIVALDMLAHQKSGEFEYADIGQDG